MFCYFGNEIRDRELWLEREAMTKMGFSSTFGAASVGRRAVLQ